MEAHDRLRALALPASDTILDAAIGLVRDHVAARRMDVVDADQLEHAIVELRKHGTMTSMIERTWELLRERVADTSVQGAIDALEPRTARGACSGGEVSAATFGFGDGSYLILVDHGLATLTWLAAELAVLCSDAGDEQETGDVSVPAEVAARAMRLGAARSAVQIGAGSVPSLLLRGDDMLLASDLVVQMDMFVMAHEVAHILLGHMGTDGSPFGAVGGSNRLLGKSADLERAADLLAVTLVLDDVLQGGSAHRGDIAVRVGAVHLFLAVLDLYESHTFVLQPTTHPPALRRWAHLVDDALGPWFGDGLDDLLRVSTPLVGAMAALSSTGGIDEDAAVVEEHLGEVLDTAVWRQEHWRDMAKLNAALNMTGRDAVETLLSWKGWGETDGSDQVSVLVREALESPEVGSAVGSALRGDAPLTKLALLETIEPLTRQLGPPRPSGDPFPAWALANVCGDLLARAHGRY